MRTHLDLFSGIGGFAIAAQACGYTTIGFCEREPYAQQILKERFGAVLADAVRDGRHNSGSCKDCGNEKGHTKSVIQSGSEWECQVATLGAPRLHPDIFTLDGADYAGVDLLTGGFTCQPFSVAGKRKGAADDRAIWPEMLRVISEAKPTWIIGENVAGIGSMELDNILSDLEGIGYSAWPLVIPACAVDARHRRDRVWIIARRDVEDSAGERSWELGRVAHGIPNRAHRLRGLGNAIVQQVAEEIIRAITNLR
jgi:DNA (cytosine-5)-methyltransferase 1